MIAWIARHPTAANLFMAAIVILGLVALPDVIRETFPKVKNDQVQILVVYPGATTEETEDAVCRRIEDAVEGVADLEETRCEAREGMATAITVMREGAAMQRFLDDIKSEVDAITDFPDAVEMPIVEEIGRTDRVISIAITGPRSPVALKAYAEDMKARIQSIEGVAKVTISGFSEHQFRIEVPTSRLRQFGLSASDIAAAVSRNSVSSPGGRLEGVEDILLRIDNRGTDLRELQELVVVSGKTGASIKLGDIANITERFERDENKIRFNGERAALLGIEKTSNQDILNVLARVSSFVAGETHRVPPNMTLTLTQDTASLVQDRLDMLLRNGIQGLILVFLVLWLFFSLRYSFWVTMGLPVSFLGALFLLPLFGVTINMISMVGLLIGIGLLMDDAIVIAENIASRMRHGDTPMHAAIEGAKQVMPGILSSFATTLLVFGSLAFITGDIGQILRVMPIVLILVISVSLIEAFMILPSHLGHSLLHMKNRAGTSRFRAAFESGFDTLTHRVFGPMLDAAIAYRYLTLGLAMMALMIAVAMPVGGKLKFVGFPSVDGDILEARLLLPQGTPLERTERIVTRIEQALAEVNTRFKADQPGGQNLVQNVTVVFNENPDAYESGPHVARVIADLLGAETRATSIDDLQAAWREAVGGITDVISLKFTEPSIGPGGRAIDIRLVGSNLEALEAASLEFQVWLGRYDGVIDLSDDLRPGKREYRLRLKDGAGVLGINARTLADQVRAAFQGITVDEFTLGQENYEVDLRLVGEDRDGPDDLFNMTVVSPSGAEVPLPVVADIEEVRGWARINRVNGQRAITLQGDVDRDRANAQELITLAQKEFLPGLLKRYPGIRFEVQGESNESAKTGQSIIRNVLLGLIGVYMLLALQFRGYLAPLTVMLVIPTSLIGVIFGHMALGLDLTMPSMVGMASLFGVVVNDSILLVVFIRQAREKGVAVFDAARQAGRSRFRPILLTSITTVAGLLPLLAETSLQAQILIPLATSLAFGLTTATLSALFLVPAIYCVLDDFGALGNLQDTDEPLAS